MKYSFTKEITDISLLQDYIKKDVDFAQKLVDLNLTLLYSNFMAPNEVDIFFDGSLDSGGQTQLTNLITNYTEPTSVTVVNKLQIDGVNFDAQGHLLTSLSTVNNETNPQWFTPIIPGVGDNGTLTTTGNGAIDYFDIQFPMNTSLETGILHIDPTSNVPFGVDSIDAYLIDIDNILGNGANFVIFQFLKNIRVRANSDKIFDDPGKEPLAIFAGLYIRIKYTAKAGSPSVAFIPEFKIRL